MVVVADLIAYRCRHDRLVERLGTQTVPTRFGAFAAVTYRSTVDGTEHVALVKGDVAGRADVLVRVHAACIEHGLLHDLRCDCREKRDAALVMIEREGEGVLLHLSPQTPGGARADGVVDPREVTVDLREYGIGAQILADLGLTSIRLLTTTPKRIHGLEGYGLTVGDQLALERSPLTHGLA
jgi:3,4-dihydroxy 2-butanone 4-phosphate synthase/GTP cyclohydrolase II